MRSRRPAQHRPLLSDEIDHGRIGWAHLAACSEGTRAAAARWLHAMAFTNQGTMLDDSNGPFGGFSKIADAHVSADGATIGTDEGQLVTEITWLGVRAKTSAQN